MLCDLELCNEHHLGDVDDDLPSAIREVFSLERPAIMTNSFSSSAMQNVYATALGCFLMTHVAIFLLNNCEKNKCILRLSLHSSAVVLQLCHNSSSHLKMNGVRLSSFSC